MDEIWECPLFHLNGFNIEILALSDQHYSEPGLYSYGDVD
jgi:hypothetical protein